MDLHSLLIEPDLSQRFSLKVVGRWDIRVIANPSGVFSSRQAAFIAGVEIHEARPASFDAKAVETTAELLDRLALNRHSARINYVRLAA